MYLIKYSYKSGGIQMIRNGTDETGETRCFLRFNPNTGLFDQDKDKDCSPLPIPHGYACKGSAYGWVFLVGDVLDTKLMNPFTGEEIQLPSVSTLPLPVPLRMGDINKVYVLKAVFSSDPSLQPAPIVMVIHRGAYDDPMLAYCKPGDTLWNQPLLHAYSDIIFYQDQFYAISHPGYITAHNIGRRTDDNDHSVRKTLITPGPSYTLIEPIGILYLVIWDGRLLRIRRNITEDYDLVPAGFQVQLFVASENRWVTIKHLGDHALFLGKHTSFSLIASEHPGCIPNAIYFTEDGHRVWIRYGSL